MDLPTYTNIWRIEKRLYKLYDFRLPMPIPVGQIAVFAAIAVPYVLILKIVGLPFSHTLLWLYILPPGALAWLVTRPVLEGKRLPELVVSQVRYLNEPRSWCRMAPLAEKDQIVIVARVWRRAGGEVAVVSPAPVVMVAGPEVAVQPDVAAVQPDVAAVQPDVAAVQPDVAAVQPAAVVAPRRPALERHLPTGRVRGWPGPPAEDAGTAAPGAPAARDSGAKAAPVRPAREAPREAARAEPVEPALPARPAAVRPAAKTPEKAAACAVQAAACAVQAAAPPAVPDPAAARAVQVSPATPEPSSPPPPPGPPASPPRPRPVVTVSGDGPGEQPMRLVERALGNPAQRRAAGWHDRVVVVPGGHRPGRPDQLQRDRARARLQIPGKHRVVVLGCTVGAGQTVTTLMTGELLASLRDEQVAVLDLNPGDAALAQRALAVPSLAGPVPPAPSRLEVVTGETAGGGGTGAEDVTRIFELLSARYPLTLADPGAAAVPRVLATASQLILVAPANQDAATALASTREWLEAHGHGGLADSAITVLNGVSRHTMAHVEHAEALARGRCRAIVRVPWDDGLKNRPERGATSAPAPGAPGTLSQAALHAYTALAGVLVTALAGTPDQLRARSGQAAP